MLEALKKAFGNEPKEKLELNAPDEKLQTGVKENLNTNINEQLSLAQQTIVELNTQVGNMTAEIAGYKQELESLRGFAAEAEAKAKAAEAEMKAKELADKKQQLADVIGKDNPKLDETFSAISSLDTESFNVVVGGFKAAFVVESETSLFQEKGVSGEADTSKVEESAEMKILKARFKK